MILYYSLEMKPEYENEFQEVSSYKGYAYSFKMTNLMPGFSYRFRVRAVNKEGAGPYSASSAAIYTAISPSTPEDLRLVSRSDVHIHISWTAPRSSGGLPLTGFKVFRAMNSNEFT